MASDDEDRRCGLSPAEQLALDQMESGLTEQDPALDAALRYGCPRAVTPRPALLAALLLSGSALIGAAAMIAGPAAGLAAALSAVAVAVVCTLWWRARHGDPTAKRGARPRHP